MWRAGLIALSSCTAPSPNAEAASREPDTRAAGSSAGNATRKAPLAASQASVASL